MPENIDILKYPQIRDCKDLPILVCAIASNADILLTGDKDFDEIDVKKPSIINPNYYYETVMQKNGSKYENA